MGDVSAGSGIAFEDASEHELKGVPERWRLTGWLLTPTARRGRLMGATLGFRDLQEDEESEDED